MKIYRVAVVGAECTGKTQLCLALSQALLGVTFTEPLRAFVEQKGQAPQAHQQKPLIESQIEQEQKVLKQAQALKRSWVLCDSAPLMTAAYSEVYYQDSGLWALAKQHHLHYDFTLWCMPDLPWQADQGQRDGVFYREQVHLALKKHMPSNAFQVKGKGHKRAQGAQDFLLQQIKTRS